MTLDEYAQLYRTDAAAADAARQAARDAGVDQPQGFREGVAANLAATRGERFEDTPLARSRVEAAVPGYARIGAEAYVAGRRGNTYTDYLKARFG